MLKAGHAVMFDRDTIWSTSYRISNYPLPSGHVSPEPLLRLLWRRGRFGQSIQQFNPAKETGIVRDRVGIGQTSCVCERTLDRQIAYVH